MDRHHVQQVCPFFATKFSLHERSRDSPFNKITFDKLQEMISLCDRSLKATLVVLFCFGSLRFPLCVGNGTSNRGLVNVRSPKTKIQDLTAKATGSGLFPCRVMMWPVL